MSFISDLSLFRRKGPITSAVEIVERIGAGDKGPDVLLIQHALLRDGAQLDADSDYGSITTAAVRAFQGRKGLEPTGYVDVKTAKALDAVPERRSRSTRSIRSGAPWLSQMRAITGTDEVPGTANSPIIMSWRGDIAKAFPKMANYAAEYTGDSIPWCGFGLGACCAREGIEPPFGPTATDKFMWADSWRSPNWGQPLPRPTSNDFIVGSIMTFTREGGGHVALLEGMEGNGTAIIRGCNQSDTVNVVRKGMGQFTAATWPAGVPIVRVPGVTTDAVPAGSER